jgi:hypothetical protein
MDIIVFSDDKKVRKYFEPLAKDKKINLTLQPVRDLKKGLKKIGQGSAVYIDISRMKKPELSGILKSLKKLNGVIFCAVDPVDSADDVAALFHDGISDYIGSGLLKKKIDSKRIVRAAEFSLASGSLPAAVREEPTEYRAEKKYKLTGNDWNKIKPGQEYTFAFMFIELDDQKELRRTLGETNISKPIESFRNTIGQFVEQINGRIWMWRDFCGLILFPFDGKQCDAILAGIRLMLYRKTIGAEMPNFNAMISYRVAVHVGDTVYKARGDTGEIISDSINAIFHLGQKFAKPCGFYLTEEAFEFVGSKLKEIFVSAGQYEGREIKKLKTLL